MILSIKNGRVENETLILEEEDLIKATLIDDDYLRPVEDFPGYFVSRDGDVYSNKTRDGELIKLGIRRAGGKPNHRYRQACLFKDSKNFYLYVHRLVAKAFIGPIPDGYEVDHINKNTEDNRLENLRIIPLKTNRASKRKNETSTGTAENTAQQTETTEM